MAGSADQSGESAAARRRRIEKMREKRELMDLLDDFGDGEIDSELEQDLKLDLDDDDDGEGRRYVAAEDTLSAPADSDDITDEDDQEFLDEPFEEDD